MSERPTPYQLAFAAAGPHFEAIAAAGVAHGIDLRDPDILLALPETAALVHDLGADLGDAGYAQLGLLVFHGFHAWRTGGLELTVTPAELEALVAAPGLGTWMLQAPAEAGYVVLPRHRLWTPPEPDAAAEAVDGFFWTMVTGGPVLHLLLVQGVHPASEGFSVFEVSAPLPPEGHWGDLHARPEGADFANVLPGGELGGLFGLATAGELLKLASRVFHYFEGNGPLRDRAGAGGDRQPPRADG